MSCTFVSRWGLIPLDNAAITREHATDLPFEIIHHALSSCPKDASALPAPITGSRFVHLNRGSCYMRHIMTKHHSL